MFDIAMTMLRQFFNLIPVGITIVLVFNIISDLLFGRKGD